MCVCVCVCACVGEGNVQIVITISMEHIKIFEHNKHNHRALLKKIMSNLKLWHMPIANIMLILSLLSCDGLVGIS